MNTPSRLLAQLDLTGTSPTVGGLMALCEENYGSLLRLAPLLRSARGVVVSARPGRTRLQMEILEQTRHTTVLRLTHLFRSPEDPVQWLREPDAVLKAYHDAKQVEVLDLRQTALPIVTHYAPPALFSKWKANLFVSKWLAYCLRGGYRITSASSGDIERAHPTSSVA
jgi:uncharacterized protein YqiB (DUF1249 family)